MAGTTPEHTDLHLEQQRQALLLYMVLPKKERKMCMNLKKITASLMTFLMLLAMTACGQQEAAVRDTDSVVIAISSEPETLDPTKGWGHGSAPIIQSTLLYYNGEMELVNDLATDYALSGDGLTWTFTIRDDAYFTDGEPVTAADVAFTLETAKAAQGSVDLTYMERAEAVDDTTLVVTLSKPTSVFLNTLASIGIVPEHAYSDSYGTNPAVGSGPYQFVEWRAQEQLILRANENYYGGAPAIKNVTIVFMDEDAALAAVKAGQVDVACTAATLATTVVEGYHVEAVDSADNRGFTLPVLPEEGNVTASGHPIGNDVTCNLEIRQAIAYAIDRQLVADLVLNGYGRPAYSENDGMPWNNPETVIETDVDYAKKLLADAGWSDSDGDGIVEKNGVKAQFNCLYPSGDSVRQAVAMAAAEQVAQIGIKITVEGASWDEITKRMFSEAVMMGWGSAIPNETYYLYYSEGALLDDFYNPEGYRNETTDAYLTAAMEALTVEEAYENWQLAQWDGETGTAMQGQCPWVWIVNLDHLYFVRDGLRIGSQAIHPHGSSMPLLQNLREWSWSE